MVGHRSIKHPVEDSLHVGFGEIRIETLGCVFSEARGTITNITQGAVHVKVSRILTAGSVRVWFSPNCHSDGLLIFCHAEEDAFRAGIHFPPDPRHHKRSELRIPLPSEPAVVFQLEGKTQVKCDARAIDISRSGLGLLVDQPLAVNAWIKVELAFAIVFGEVLYSKAEASVGHRVGLRIETLLMRDGQTGKEAELLNRPLSCELEA